MDQLGVSRTPIREALRRLEQERLIADTGKGSLVLGITEDDLLDIDEAVGGRIFERAKTAFSLKPDRSRNYRLKGVVEL